MKKLYYKNKLLVWLIKPFENRRLFTALQLAIYTLKDHRLWPEKLVALDAFCQTGLQWTRIFSNEASYLEMWDIDPEAIQYARKEFPGAEVVCGDSIEAFVNKRFKRNDFNFVLIDSPVPFKFPDGTFEHFGFFDHIFQTIGARCVIIMDVVPDIARMIARHPVPDSFANEWAEARKQFYTVKDGYYVSPQKMQEVYSEKIKQLGYKADLVTYNARNGFFGFMIMAVSK